MLVCSLYILSFLITRLAGVSDDFFLNDYTGLQKILETVSQVEELGGMLSIKQAELTHANKLANQKLQQMVEDQQDAEKKRTLSVSMREELRIKEQEVADRKSKVCMRLVYNL